MLFTVQIIVFIAFVVGDLLVLKPYIGAGSGGHLGRRYPTVSFWTHVGGGLGALAFGAIALTAFLFEQPRAGAMVAVAQGVAVVVFAGTFALPLSRHTLGLKGFNLVGYVSYTLMWIFSGLLLISAPSIERAYACFVLTHAYLTCRVFVAGLRWLWPRLTGQRIDADLNYSIATSIAAMIPLVLAWGEKGLLAFLASTGVAVVLHALGFSSPWHARHKAEDTDTVPEPFPEVSADLRLAVVTATIDLS